MPGAVGRPVQHQRLATKSRCSGTHTTVIVEERCVVIPREWPSPHGCCRRRCHGSRLFVWAGTHDLIIDADRCFSVQRNSRTSHRPPGIYTLTCAYSDHHIAQLSALRPRIDGLAISLCEPACQSQVMHAPRSRSCQHLKRSTCHQSPLLDVRFIAGSQCSTDCRLQRSTS